MNEMRVELLDGSPSWNGSQFIFQFIVIVFGGGGACELPVCSSDHNLLKKPLERGVEDSP